MVNLAESLFDRAATVREGPKVASGWPTVSGSDKDPYRVATNGSIGVLSANYITRPFSGGEGDNFYGAGGAAGMTWILAGRVVYFVQALGFSVFGIWGFCVGGMSMYGVEGGFQSERLFL